MSNVTLGSSRASRVIHKSTLVLEVSMPPVFCHAPMYSTIRSQGCAANLKLFRPNATYQVSKQIQVASRAMCASRFVSVPECRSRRRSLWSSGQSSQPHLDGMSIGKHCVVHASSQAVSAQQQTGPDISQLSPALQSQWNHEKNTHLGSIVIKPYSMRKVWWICSDCPDGNLHNWQAIVQSRTRSRGCPYCSGRAVCPHNSLARKAPHLAKEWDPNRNHGLPSDYTVNSTHVAHWICQRNHQWQVKICARFSNKTGCPVCAEQLKGKRKLPVLTASSSHIMQLWDWEQNAKSGIDPSIITCGSGKKACFKCNQCPKAALHQWTALIRTVVRGSGCPYCSGHRVCKCNSLQAVRPDVAAEWCYAKNSGTPGDYSARSHVDAWWQNERRGVWKETMNSRYRSSLNSKAESDPTTRSNSQGSKA